MAKPCWRCSCSLAVAERRLCFVNSSGNVSDRVKPCCMTCYHEIEDKRKQRQLEAKHGK